MRSYLMCLSLVMVMAWGVQASNDKIPLDQLPAAVTAAVKAKFPKAEWVSAEKETQDNKTTYEVRVKNGSSQVDVNLKSDGTITGYESTIEVKDLPQAITAAVKQKYPQAEMKSAEIVYEVVDGKDQLKYYEVMVKDGDKEVEVEVLPDGKLKPQEKK